jgi:hypothetical protein
MANGREHLWERMWENQMTIEKPLQIRHYSNRKADDVSADEQSTAMPSPPATDHTMRAEGVTRARSLKTFSNLGRKDGRAHSRTRERSPADGWTRGPRPSPGIGPGRSRGQNRSIGNVAPLRTSLSPIFSFPKLRANFVEA